MRPSSLSFNETTTESTYFHSSTGSQSFSESPNSTTAGGHSRPRLSSSLDATTTPAPTCKHNCSCVGECGVFPPDLIEVKWWPYHVISTVTAATLFHVVHNGTNYTTTSMKHNTQSDGRRYQDFNAGGTTQTTITYATALNASTTRVMYVLASSL